MRAYECLTRVGRLRRLRRLGATAISRFDLPEAQLTFLRQINHILFRVRCPRGHFLLRVHDLERHSENELRSEFLWLAALKHEAHLAVPEPVPARDGSAWIDVEVEGVPEPRRCVLFHWVPGRRKRSSLHAADTRACGSYMARLHEHSAQWSVPEGFRRPRWDWERLFGDTATLWKKGPAVYSHGDLTVFREASERVSLKLRVLGEGREVFGLIHSDPHPANFVFDRGEATAIDFEDSGWGYYLFDLTVMLTELEDYGDRSAPMQTALLDGYQRIRSLPRGYHENLETFKAMRVVDLVNWVLGWDTPTLRPWGPRFLRHAVQRLIGFLET
ncbi:MAG: phosphotransferase enzyme family protein [Armatimonadota bacterium]